MAHFIIYYEIYTQSKGQKVFLKLGKKLKNNKNGGMYEILLQQQQNVYLSIYIFNVQRACIENVISLSM